MRPNRSDIGNSRRCAIAGLLACAAASSLIVPAATSRAGEAQRFRLCADPTDLPFSSDGPSQPGFYVELGQALAQAIGQPIACDWYKSYFDKRTVHVTLLDKQCDAMIGLPRSAAGITTGTGAGAAVVQIADVVATETKGDALAPNAEAVSTGKEAFNGTCAHCHGPDAIQSERKIDLRLLRHRYGDEMREKFWTTVHEGRPAKGMPAWKEVFTDDQFESIYAFLLTVQSPADPAN